MRVLFFLALICVSITLPSASEAESDDPAQDKKSLNSYEGESEAYPRQSAERATPASSDDSGSRIFPAVWCADITDPETQDICWKAYREGLAYYKRGLTHRSQVLGWQHVSTRIIFFTVLFLVGTGIYFAWVQFKAGTGLQKNSEIEISTQGIKVSSPVLGVIILVLSLAFFYLYLRYVYPINEII
jgi:hypothetical protein